ncbi:MAG TPA: hypothetical protein VIG57_07365 [Candidatus Entotheonella sp.]|jgi:hypothetical protein
MSSRHADNPCIVQSDRTILVEVDSPRYVEPLSPPDPESLHYEILRAMGVVSPQDDPYEVRNDRLDQYLRQPVEMQGWNWVRAWIEMQLWQDGIGVVPDRDNPHEPVRIEPPSLRKARILLVWALCRVAHGATAWLGR